MMSTEQMRFAKRICKKSKFAPFDGQNKPFLPVSDALIDYLCARFFAEYNKKPCI